MADINLVVAEPLNFTIKRGDSFGPIPFTLTRSGYDWSQAGGTIIRTQWRKTSNAAPVVDLTPVVSYPVLGEATFDLEIDASNMENIAAGTYLHDIEVTNPHGKVVTYIQGKITVEQDTTQPT